MKSEIAVRTYLHQEFYGFFVPHLPMRGHRFHTSFGAVFGGQYVDDGLRVFTDHLGIFNFGLFAMPIHSMLTRPGNWMAFVTWQLVFF